MDTEYTSFVLPWEIVVKCINFLLTSIADGFSNFSVWFSFVKMGGGYLHQNKDKIGSLGLHNTSSCRDLNAFSPHIYYNVLDSRSLGRSSLHFMPYLSVITKYSLLAHTCRLFLWYVAFIKGAPKREKVNRTACAAKKNKTTHRRDNNKKNRKDFLKPVNSKSLLAQVCIIFFQMIIAIWLSFSTLEYQSPAEEMETICGMGFDKICLSINETFCKI